MSDRRPCALTSKILLNVLQMTTNTTSIKLLSSLLTDDENLCFYLFENDYHKLTSVIYKIEIKKLVLVQMDGFSKKKIVAKNS